MDLVLCVGIALYLICNNIHVACNAASKASRNTQLLYALVLAVALVVVATVVGFNAWLLIALYTAGLGVHLLLLRGAEVCARKLAARYPAKQ
jgi:hypothetical protein